jgi:hypothetical protein
VLRLGWSPQNSIPGLVDTLFRRRESDAQKAVPAPAPPTPLPSTSSAPEAPRQY